MRSKIIVIDKIEITEIIVKGIHTIFYLRLVTEIFETLRCFL